MEIKIYGAFVLNQRVVLHAIDAAPARWRGDAGSSPLDGASTAASSPRNDLVNYRVHPTHWLISTQVTEYSWQATRERAIVFFSHQWLGDTQADPEAIQFGVMKKALLSVAATAKLQLADLYVWADLCSIRRTRA